MTRNIARKSVYSQSIGPKTYEFKLPNRNFSVDQTDSIGKQLFPFDVANLKVNSPAADLAPSAYNWQNDEVSKLIRL